MRARLLVAALSLLGSLEVAGATAERRILLRTPPVSPAIGIEASPMTVRSRFVDVDASSLRVHGLRRGERKREQRLLSITLFPDTTVDVRLTDVERTPIGSVVWSGVMEGQSLGRVVISVMDESVHASLSNAAKRYLVEGLPGGLHQVRELDMSRFPREGEPVPVFAVPGAQVPVEQDDGSQIDVMVAYTGAVRSVLGSTAAVEALATSAVAAANGAYENSGVTARLRLVGTMEVEYDEPVSFSITLSRLRNSSDGFMDSVHAFRDATGADAVSLMVHQPEINSCGTGYVMQTVSSGFAASAFNVTRYDCANGNYSLAHEFGHNFGLAHDRANAGVAGSSDYSYGYQDTEGAFRDIMAYEDGCPGPCPRLQYFSNPDVLYLGRPFGVHYLQSNAADNRRALNENAATMANWRQEVAPPVTFTDDPLNAGVTSVKALHLLELRDAIDSKRAEAGLPSFSWSVPPVIGGKIVASLVTEMRLALTPALEALGATASYTDSPLTPGSTRIKAVHIQELRNYIE